MADAYEDVYEDDYEEDFEEEEDPYATEPKKEKRTPVKAARPTPAPEPARQEVEAVSASVADVRLDDSHGPGNRLAGVNMNLIDFGDVTLDKTIGGGGAGLVYSGKYQGKHVAIKTLIDPRLTDQMIKDFTEEAQLLAMLRHPHIIAYYAACLKPPKMCIVSELCSRTVFDIIHGGKDDLALPRMLIWKIAMDTAQAFRYLHDEVKPMVIHRDLKSHNLLVNNYDDRRPEKCEIKLCDFGLARDETQKGMGGTPAYMPPELLTNSEYNEKVDVYAFGILVFEMFAREVPFDGYAPAEIRRKVLKGDRPNIPSHTPRPWQKLIKECWHQDIIIRPQFSQIVQRLEGIKKDMDEMGGYGTSAMVDLPDDSLDSLSSVLKRPMTGGRGR